MKKLYKLGFVIFLIFLIVFFILVGCNDKSKFDIKFDENIKLFYFDINLNNKVIIIVYNCVFFDDFNNIVV